MTSNQTTFLCTRTALSRQIPFFVFFSLCVRVLCVCVCLSVCICACIYVGYGQGDRVPDAHHPVHAHPQKQTNHWCHSGAVHFFVFRFSFYIFGLNWVDMGASSSIGRVSFYLSFFLVPFYGSPVCVCMCAYLLVIIFLVCVCVWCVCLSVCLCLSVSVCINHSSGVEQAHWHIHQGRREVVGGIQCAGSHCHQQQQTVSGDEEGAQPRTQGTGIIIYTARSARARAHTQAAFLKSLPVVGTFATFFFHPHRHTPYTYTPYGMVFPFGFIM